MFRRIGELEGREGSRNKLLKLIMKGMSVALKSGLKIIGGIMNNTVLEFKCVGMDNGGKFPIEYTGRGQDISPEFIIKNLSPNAETLAVILEDLSHPIKDFTHWIIWNIPATDRIKKNIPAGKAVPIFGNARQGIGYGWYYVKKKYKLNVDFLSNQWNPIPPFSAIMSSKSSNSVTISSRNS